MAVLAADQVDFVMGDSRTDMTGLFAVKRVNTADTLDVSQWFKSAKLAIVLWTTTAKADKLAAPAGNVVTFSTTGLSDDAGWLLVWGARA
jgi:hypothetical protein